MATPPSAAAIHGERGFDSPGGELPGGDATHSGSTRAVRTVTGCVRASIGASAAVVAAGVGRAGAVTTGNAGVDFAATGALPSRFAARAVRAGDDARRALPV